MHFTDFPLLFLGKFIIKVQFPYGNLRCRHIIYGPVRIYIKKYEV